MVYWGFFRDNEKENGNYNGGILGSLSVWRSGLFSGLGAEALGALFGGGVLAPRSSPSQGAGRAMKVLRNTCYFGTDSLSLMQLWTEDIPSRPKSLKSWGFGFLHDPRVAKFPLKTFFITELSHQSRYRT